MQTRDIFVIGSSAGGVEALSQVCSMLPPDFPGAIFIAQHISPTSRSVLPYLLDRAGPLPALSPVDGQAIETGNIYVAAPDHHMLLRPGHVLMRRGPSENRTRPAANALFRSAALAYGGRVVGVVLTGLLDDGTDGLIAIKAAGGLSVVQDPESAAWPSMPRNALKRDHVDRVVPLPQIAGLLQTLARELAPPTIPLPDSYVAEDLIAAQEFAVVETDVETPGQPSPLSCPDCGGVLNVMTMAAELRFRCQVGHAFTPLGLAEAQTAELERALGIAVRTHRDRIRLFCQLGENAHQNQLLHAAKHWEKALAESEQMIRVLERAVAALRKPADDSTG